MTIKQDCGLTLLLIAFIVLRLCHVINWPWLWVLAPFWIPLTIFVAACVVYAILTLLQKAKNDRR